jgi:DNA-directed RNA polymerase specialized sigma24 family protein
LWVELDVWVEIDNKDKLKEIFKYINWLKKEHKEIFLYRIWSDLSYKEIADITWIEVNNCRQIVSRILKNIEANFA